MTSREGWLIPMMRLEYVLHVQASRRDSLAIVQVGKPVRKDVQERALSNGWDRSKNHALDVIESGW